MSKNISALRRMGHGLLACSLACTLGLAACSSTTTTTETDSEDEATTEEAASDETTTEEASGSTLAAPSDLEVDFSTGEFTFTSNDENMGYYFLRVYENVDGEQGSEYVATSKRINGGSTGEMSGTLDLSELGWATYNFNIVSAAASGSDDEAPDPVVYTYQLGAGGVMERPEMMVLADGNTAEFYIDLYTLSDWNKMQRMPTVEFNIYSDADCTQLVETVEADLSDLAPQEAAGPWATGTMWASDSEGTHKYLEPTATEGADATSSSTSEAVALLSQAVVDDLDAGTYYVTATAKGSDDGLISDSQASEAVEFTVTADAMTGEFTATKTSMWADPEYGSMGLTAQEGTYTDRVDYAGAQVTSGEVVS